MVQLVLGWLFTSAAVAVGLAGCAAWMDDENSTGYVIPAWFLWMIGAFLRRLGKRARVRLADQVLATDRRPPVLYLRGFNSDALLNEKHVSLNMPTDFSTIEERVLAKLGKIGPVIGLGDPENPSDAVGFAHWYADDAAWQSEVEGLLKRAAVVVALLDDSEGFNWEMTTLAKHGYLTKTLLFFPPKGSGETLLAWESLWRNFLLSLRESGVPLWWVDAEFDEIPHFLATVGARRRTEYSFWAVRFPDGEPVFDEYSHSQGYSLTRHAYECAMRVLTRDLTGKEHRPPPFTPTPPTQTSPPTPTPPPIPTAPPTPEPTQTRIERHCPHCQRRLRLPASTLGIVKCPGCEQRFEADTR